MLLLRIRNTRDKKPGNRFSDNKDDRSNLYFKKNLSIIFYKTEVASNFGATSVIMLDD